MNKQLTETEKAYIAGLFDGEGCLGIHKQDRSRWGNKSIAYRAHVSLANTYVPVLQKIKSLIGGKIVEQGIGKKCFVLTFTVGVVRNWLPEVVEYMVVKKEQAKVMLGFLERVSQHGFKPSIPELSEFYEKCFVEIRDFKKERFKFKEEFKILGVRKCAYCENSFVLTSKSPLKKYCNSSCGNKAGIERYFSKKNILS
jgi:hypothetical protein